MGYSYCEPTIVVHDLVHVALTISELQNTEYLKSLFLMP